MNDEHQKHGIVEGGILKPLPETMAYFHTHRNGSCEEYDIIQPNDEEEDIHYDTALLTVPNTICKCMYSTLASTLCIKDLRKRFNDVAFFGTQILGMAGAREIMDTKLQRVCRAVRRKQNTT